MVAVNADSPSRLSPVRRRVTVAKVVLGAAGVAVFGGAMGLAKLSYGGHQKQRPTTLTPPNRFVAIVKANQLEAGIIAPAGLPPGAATAQS